MSEPVLTIDTLRYPELQDVVAGKGKIYASSSEGKPSFELIFIISKSILQMIQHLERYSDVFTEKMLKIIDNSPDDEIMLKFRPSLMFSEKIEQNKVNTSNPNLSQFEKISNWYLEEIIFNSSSNS